MRPNRSDLELTVSVAIVATRLRPECLSSSSQALAPDDNQPPAGGAADFPIPLGSEIPRLADRRC
jgi:hypothetical protein